MTFEPTHRTINAIGAIPSGTPIRVANITSFDNFGDLLAYLGDQPYISYKNHGHGVVFKDDRVLYDSNTVLPGDYVLTDGDRFAVTSHALGFRENLDTTYALRFRMSNGDEYSSRDLTQEDADVLLDYARDFKNTKNIWFKLTDNSKVLLNPQHISSVEVIEND